MTQDEIDRARRGVSTLLDVMRPNCVINATFVPAIHAAIDAAEDALRAAQGRPTIEVRWTQQSMRYGRATTVSHTGERDEALAALLAAQEQREWRAELESAADRERVTLDELRELRRQLPKGMEHCTILLKECAKGHGWLTAENWVQHGCPTCEADALREALAALIAAQWTPTCATCERWAPTSRTESFCERFSRFMDPDDGCIKGYRAGRHRDRVKPPGAQA